MPPAARITDKVGHGAPTGTVGLPGPPPAGGVPTVLIGGLPAAVVSTVCVCPVPPQHAALGPSNLVQPGPPPARGPVLIGGFAAARMGDKSVCGAVILTGAPTVLIGG
ncbi:PAAR domain-containing protein [Actinomycetes bacterium KLBMP 9797]